jgi:hypothetical protein
MCFTNNINIQSNTISQLNTASGAVYFAVIALFYDFYVFSPLFAILFSFIFYIILTETALIINYVCFSL